MNAVTDTLFQHNPQLTLLSSLLLDGPQNRVPSEPGPVSDSTLLEMDREEFEQTRALADSHHVVVRSMQIFRDFFRAAGDEIRAAWAEQALERERLRIENALSFLWAICDGLESAGCHITVIKSLDHWPDLGSDLDLYTNAEPPAVIGCMSTHFHARLAARSWGDRLANKWNFVLPGLPEAVEIHMGRLGQTGEQLAIAASLTARSRPVKIANWNFRVPAAEDRLMISTLQRIYRHFNARLCDIVDFARLLEADGLDYAELRDLAGAAGIWEGVATYLAVMSDYVACFRGRGLDLPHFVLKSARFGGNQIGFREGFLRFPILPHSARLYASELKTLMVNGKLRSTVRLSLLPCLATAAVVGLKLTGSDKGIW
jgi:hypothetical protein